MERVYNTILSEEYIVAFGPNIVDQICVALKAKVVVSDLFVGFLPPDISPKYFDNIVNFILLIYV